MHPLRPLSLALVSLLACQACGGGGPVGASHPSVVASFYPLAFVAQEVGGDMVEVNNLTPPGAEPHDLELTPSQARELYAADLVVYVGGGFQPAVENALDQLQGSALDVLDAQDDLLQADESGENEHQGEAGEGHIESSVDPHVWLGPQRFAEIARVTGDRLAELDPDNADEYEANAERLVSRLDRLDAAFRSGLASCKRSTIVTTHEAFGYLASAYGLEEVGISGIDPEAEPSPHRLAEIAEFAEDTGVTTIFFEVLVPAETASTLADEIGVDTARLDPLEGPPGDGDYFSAMRANLAALREGLGCT